MTTFSDLVFAQSALDLLHEKVVNDFTISSTASQYALLHINEAMIQLDYVQLALENK